MTTLTIPSRFRGPASSGNGGWTAGALAALLDPVGPVEVTLRVPPPLDVPMPVSEVDGVLVATHDGVTVAEARSTSIEPTAPEPVDAVTATAAEASYAGLRNHPFPTCFSCGTGREPGDGLRIFPGPIQTGQQVVAATWVPDPSVAEGADGRATLAVTWAALDCAGAWSGYLDSRPVVLGRMAAVVHERPSIGERQVVVGKTVEVAGRKTLTATALYGADGRLRAAATHVWITIDPEAFR
ncbi:MAG: hypothetical protein QM714_15885 [Nocardioides sp.]|uniref:hypothetical protein n=1 Tax=Nocardioides sp. TaxID=35761 RepID=UPI0039E4D240